MKTRLTFVFAFCLLSLPFAGVARAQVPDRPTNIEASDGTLPTKVLVSWTAALDDSLVNEYLVFRSESNQYCPESAIATVASTETDYLDTPPQVDKIYYYSVRSKAAGLEGEVSDCLESDSGYAGSPPAPLPPVNVSATEDREDKILVSWVAPSGSEPIEKYRLYRSEKELFCEGTPLTEFSKDVNSYADTSATPGRAYFYTLRSAGPSGPNGGACSYPAAKGFRVEPPPPLPPANVQATDGTYEDKVVATWTVPDGSGPISNYTLHRSTSPGASCNSPLATGISIGTLRFDDTNVVPGRLYYYSMESAGSGGKSVCSSIDPGHARIGPATISATDGTFPDKVVVAWTPPPAGGDIVGYTLYRNTSSAPCVGVPLSGSPFSPETRSVVDQNVSLGQTYHYSIAVLSPTGSSECREDPGFPISECSDGKDNDGDGLVDYPEDPGCESPEDGSENDDDYICDNGLDDDGDGKIDYPDDPGCDSPKDPSEDDSGAALKSPTFAKFNTFLGQWNFAELINQGETPQEVKITLYNLRGEMMIDRIVVVPPGSEVDIDINSLLMFACSVLESACEGFSDLSALRGDENGLGRPDGVVDTYGLVRLDFDDSSPKERLLGRISFYRPNTDGTYSFAFSRELRNPSSGKSYALSNTYDPQGMGYLVPNWAEVIAFGERKADGELLFSTQSFTLNIYRRDGTLKDSREIKLPALGEFDFHAGHEFVNAEGIVEQEVYLVEVIPHNPQAEYFLTVSRYSSNAMPGVDPDSYNYAFALQGNRGTTETLFAPISNRILAVEGLKETPIVTNWIEVANVGDSAATLSVLFKDADGNVVDQYKEIIAAKSQVHLNAGAVVSPGASGMVEVLADRAVIAQSMSYVHGSTNRVLSGFNSPARTRGRAIQAGTINTFLEMQDVLQVASTSASTVSGEYLLTSFDGGSSSGLFSFASGESSVFSISNNGVLDFPYNTYGALTLATPNDGDALGAVYRVRVDEKGMIDFVMYTPIQ